MAAHFTTVGLIGKYNDSSVCDTVNRVVSHLRDHGCTLLLDEHTAAAVGHLEGVEVASRHRIGEEADLVVVIGGDGTLLNAARSLADFDLPLLGVNLGRLGFLVDISPARLEQSLSEIFAGHYHEEQRTLLHARVVRGGEVLSDSYAFNDVVVHKWEAARMIAVETSIDGVYLNSTHADGLIVATPTGSTAYALSGGGPILHPTMDAVVLVPICPHTMSNRPIVVPGSSQIQIVVNPGGNDNAQATCDGQISLALSAGDHILVERAQRPVRLIHPVGHDHFAVLRAKLHWGRRLTDA